MSEPALIEADKGDLGFWRLQHEHLTAFLARSDLSWELARVYLALADLTWGYGRERDIISIGQVAERAGMYVLKPDGRKHPDYPHTARALKRLTELGLCGSTPGMGQSKTRWVFWPTPPMPTTACAGTTAKAGNSTTAGGGNGTIAIASAKAGKHQDTKKHKNLKKSAADRPPPDSRVKSFLDFFCQTYADTLGRPYIVNGGKDGATVKRLLRILDGNGVDALAELQQAARNMLGDSWGRNHASIAVLVSQINTWRGNPKAHGSGFTPAATGGADYASLVKKF